MAALREPDGFREFVRTRSSSLLGFGWTLTGSWESAEDLVQTALLKSLSRWSHIAAEDPIGYVRRVMVNTYVTASRRKRIGEILSERLPEARQESPYPGVDARLTLSTVLRRLPPRQRAVIALRYYEDLGESEIADLMGCSVGTVKSQHSKAMAKLRDDTDIRELLDKEHIR